MNRLIISGNLTREPQTRTTQSGQLACSFTVAVNRNRRNANGERETDFFRVVAFGQRGEVCQKYLDKGKKVLVIGQVSMTTYTGRDGMQHSSLDVFADEIEFLSPREQPAAVPPQSATVQEPQTPIQAQNPPVAVPDAPNGFVVVDDQDLPF